MAFSDLTPQQQEDVKEFFRDYRAAIGDLVRSLRTQQNLVTIYNQNVQPHWATINNGDEILDGTGLANTGVMTKGDWTPILQFSQDVLAALYADGGASLVAWPDSSTVDQYGVLSAGPTNIG